jgi:hypothetical protein
MYRASSKITRNYLDTKILSLTSILPWISAIKRYKYLISARRRYIE